MFKKVFALASFTALTGVIALGSAAGCSSSSTSTTSGDDSGPSTVKKDASSDRTTTPVDEDAGPSTCPSSDPVNAADLPWAPPAATQPGKCTEANLTAFQDYIKTHPQTTNEEFEQFIKTTNATCHDCIFTDVSNPKWGPIPTSGGKLVTINIGSCFALASGKEECGKAIQNEFDCEFVACQDCADDTAFQSCQKKAQTGACKPFVQAIQSGCSGVPATVDDVCGSYIDSIRIQCVTANVFDGGDK